jgi:hypothetical protein
VSIHAEIGQDPKGTFTFEFEGRGAGVGLVTNSVTVGLVIGDDLDSSWSRPISINSRSSGDF